MKREMKEFTLEDLAVGQKASVEAKLTQKMVDNFSRISGDFSSLHTSTEYAESVGFEGRVVHGLLLGSIASRLAGMELPGKYGVIQSIALKFHKPCYVNDSIAVTGEVTDIIEAVKTIIVKLRIVRKGGGLIADGKIQIGVLK